MNASGKGAYPTLRSCAVKRSVGWLRRYSLKRGLTGYGLDECGVVRCRRMKGFHANIEEETLQNTSFRRVLYTASHCQLVLMCLKPGEEIGTEVHAENDQFFRFEQGEGRCVIDGNTYEVRDGSAIIIPAGAQHNVINISDTDDLKMYTIYSPAHHKDGIVRRTREEAEAHDEEFDGVTTE